MLWASLLRDGSSGSLGVHSYDGLDVVDVCSIGSERYPFAAAALGIGRSLHLIRDVLDPREHWALRFDSLRGVAYQVIRSGDHVVMLTSECIYVIEGLASRFQGGLDPRFVDGHRVDGHSALTEMEIEAVDAYSVYDRWLFVIMPDGRSRKIEIGKFANPGTPKVFLESVLMPPPPWDTGSNHDLFFNVLAS